MMRASLWIDWLTWIVAPGWVYAMWFVKLLTDDGEDGEIRFGVLTEA